MQLPLYLLAGLLLTFATTPSNAAPSKAVRRNRYIVKLKKGAPQANFRSLLRSTNFASDNKLKYSYRPSFFNGFAGEFTNDFLKAYLGQYKDEVQYIELDGTVKAFGSQPNAPSWGLTRSGQRKLDLAAPYSYPDHGGKTVTVFVVDTGVQFDQADFGGRATLDKSVVKGEAAPDGNGHGTHCAGTIGSTTYGIAKNVVIKGVKVLNGQGSGQLSDVVAGMQHVASQAGKGRLNTVMSMSLGGPKTQSLDDAANAAVDAGVVTVVAAGNDNKDACNVSPAGASKVMTVGATDNADKKASFSNFGKCVEIWAPGVGIKSLWKGASGATNTISGTSMACPHVAGVAALFLADKAYTKVQDVYDDMIAASTKGAISGLDAASPNRLLYNLNEPMTDPNPPPPPGPPGPGPPPPPTKCPIWWPPQIPCDGFPFPDEPTDPNPGDCPPGWPPGIPCDFPDEPLQ